MTRPDVRMAIALLACLGLPGCLSTGVMELGTSPRYRFAQITEITDAALLGSDVFVQFSLLRHGRTDPEPVVLKIGVDETYWESSHSVPRASYLEGVQLAHVPAVALLAPGAIPPEAALLPIEPVEVRRTDDLKTLGNAPLQGIRVLEVHYKPETDDLVAFSDDRRGVPLPGDPILAITVPAGKSGPRTILISDVQDGHTTRRPWLLLLPFAAAADVVFLPFEFFVGLLTMD